MPWFVKQSFGKPVKKIDLILFGEGKLSIESLNISCPECGSVLKSCKITPEDGEIIGRCPNEECNKTIDNLNTTLLYCCGYIIPDSNVIRDGVISKYLEAKGIFEGFTFVLLSKVRRECDDADSKKEFEKLEYFASIGRINLIDFDTKRINDSENLSNDEIIVNAAKEIDAIIYTRDKGIYETAIAKNIFCLI